jgi:hypothetical protein
MMADGVFNIAKGAAAQLNRDNAGSGVLILLQAAEADSTLVDHEDVGALLAAAGNTEATFTNYARKTALTLTEDLDHTNDRVGLDMADQTFTDAGNGTNNSLVKAIVAISTGAGDANLIPIAHYDISVTTDGNNLTIRPHANGLYRAS